MIGGFGLPELNRVLGGVSRVTLKAASEHGVLMANAPAIHSVDSARWIY